MKNTQRLPTVVFMLTVGVLLFLTFSCKGPGGATTPGVVASVTVGDPSKAPTLIARWDTNAFVAWGGDTYVAEAYIQATGLPLYIQTGSENVAIVKVRKPEFSWTGKVGDPLPIQAVPLFRPAEIEMWGIKFADTPFPPVPRP